nr:NADH dehydrogenase subunit 2 [Octodonta nipae]
MTKIYKIVFFNFTVLGTIITISSFSSIYMWLGLEMNLLSIIPIMNEKKNTISAEATMKYFVSQAMASKILIFSFLMMEMSLNMKFMFPESMNLLMIHSALFLKMGMAPFHFWFPEVSEGLNWLSCLILFTWQKIAPMTVMMMFMKLTVFSISVILISSIIGGIMGINQSSMRKILAYSSINHMSWMIISMVWSSKMWMIYFLIYSLMNTILILMMNSLNLFNLNQINSGNLNLTSKLLISSILLSMGGLPPFIGFLPKWMIILMLTEMNLLALPTFLIIITLISLFMYLRILIPTFTLSNKKIVYPLNEKINFPISMISFSLILSLPICTLILGF